MTVSTTGTTSTVSTSSQMKTPKNVYILITQCLQNGFFLADESRLCLPRDVVLRMLVGDQDTENKILDRSSIGNPNERNQRQIDAKLLKNGPLYRFFDAVTSESDPSDDEDSHLDHADDVLHILHIRDWHTPSHRYDEERRLYGVHCEANTWEAKSLSGYEAVLSPWEQGATPEAKKANQEQAKSLTGFRCTRRTQNRLTNRLKLSAETPLFDANLNGSIAFYNIRSDSVFDFKTPESPELLNHLTQTLKVNDPEKHHQSHLQCVLDHIIYGEPTVEKRVQIVVIGVYTDVKIKTLLMGIKTRYEPEGLFVSDVLTDSPTLERHLQGLDFVAKVLNVQVIHSLNDVVSLLKRDAKQLIPDQLTRTTINYRDYAHHFVDRQYILGFQDNKLREYLELTGSRSIKVYNQISNASQFLIWFGYILLALTIIGVLAKVMGAEYPSEVVLLTGGLSFAQLLTSFYLLPIAQLRSNLASLVRLRNYLETYSSITALLRHHLTQAERLRPNTSLDKFDEIADKELKLIERQIDIIAGAAEKMRTTFLDLAPEKPSIDKPSTPPSPTPPGAGDGSPSAG